VLTQVTYAYRYNMGVLDDLANSISAPEAPPAAPAAPTVKAPGDGPDPQTRSWITAKEGTKGGFIDIMNDGEVPNITNTTTGDHHANIDDKWTEQQWKDDPLKIYLPPASELAAGTGDPCQTQCQIKKREREKKCDILRQRIQAALYIAGCPSTVGKGPPRNGGCPPTTCSGAAAVSQGFAPPVPVGGAVADVVGSSERGVANVVDSPMETPWQSQFGTGRDSLTNVLHWGSAAGQGVRDLQAWEKEPRRLEKSGERTVKGIGEIILTRQARTEISKRLAAGGVRRVVLADGKLTPAEAQMNRAVQEWEVDKV